MRRRSQRIAVPADRKGRWNLRQDLLPRLQPQAPGILPGFRLRRWQWWTLLTYAFVVSNKIPPHGGIFCYMEYPAPIAQPKKHHRSAAPATGRAIRPRAPRATGEYAVKISY